MALKAIFVVCCNTIKKSAIEKYFRRNLSKLMTQDDSFKSQHLPFDITKKLGLQIYDVIRLLKSISGKST